MDARYYVCIPGLNGMYSVRDRHHPDNTVAYCPDDMKAYLICMLLNKSWEEAKTRWRDE